MVTAAWLLRTWQSAVHMQLPALSKNRFLACPEVDALKRFDDTDLELAARAAMQADPDNRLLLVDWLRQTEQGVREREARERHELAEREAKERQAMAEREAKERREEAEREARQRQEDLTKREELAGREAMKRQRQTQLREEAMRKVELKGMRDAEDQARLRAVLPPSPEEVRERQSRVCCGQPRNTRGRCNRCGSRMSSIGLDS
jgi:hypothetical protein